MCLCLWRAEDRLGCLLSGIIRLYCRRICHWHRTFQVQTVTCKWVPESTRDYTPVSPRPQHLCVDSGNLSQFIGQMSNYCPNLSPSSDHFRFPKEHFTCPVPAWVWHHSGKRTSHSLHSIQISKSSLHSIWQGVSLYTRMLWNLDYSDISLPSVWLTGIC